MAKRGRKKLKIKGAHVMGHLGKKGHKRHGGRKRGHKK